MAEYTDEELAELERLANEELERERGADQLAGAMLANGVAAGMGKHQPNSGRSDLGDARRSNPLDRGLALAESDVVAQEMAALRQQLRDVLRDLNHTMHLVIVMAERWKISGEELAAAYEATRRAREEARRATR